MSQGHYAIERFDDDRGATYRLVGPRLTSKWYRGDEHRQRLEDIRDLMNYVLLNEETGQKSTVPNHVGGEP